MATLNLSTNGPEIQKTYQSIVNAPAPGGSAASSSTYGQWAVYSVSAPLVNAFQADTGGKESTLKVQSTGEGELVDLIDEFSDGKIQFAFLKIRDSNTGLPKSVLIAWCGEGVPERVKGYFTGHVAAVSKVLHGYHVQITARSDRDLTPESIVQKVADSSGSKYSGDAPAVSRPPPPVASKPAFTPTHSSGAGSFKPLGQTAPRVAPAEEVDDEGWGKDAPPVYRTQIERVAPAYQPTKVNIAELRKGPSGTTQQSQAAVDRPDVVRGAYQPIGKVDIAELRRQAKESGQLKDDRPEPVKGSYEPIGKVDIAAIRAKAQPPREVSPAPAAEEETSRPVSERASQFSSSERITTLPKPKVTNRFGSGAGSSFGGTKPPLPGAFGAPAASPAPQIGTASKTFADQGGKTPAQIWAEKKAKERGLSNTADLPTASAISSQTSGGNEWKSSYTGKSWAPVQTNATGRSRTSVEALEEDRQAEESPSASVGALRDRFKGAAPMGAPTIPRTTTGEDYSSPPPPPLAQASKPTGVAIPGLAPPPPRAPEPEPEYEQEEEDFKPPPPPVQARSPTPPTPDLRPSSPIRVALPVGRSAAPIEPEEPEEPEPVPTQSIGRAIPEPQDLPAEHEGHDQARAAAQHVASSGGTRARAQYDYEKTENNEIDLREGEIVTNIDQVDPDWWVGTNSAGEEGLFPSNYVEIIEDDHGAGSAPAPAAPAAPAAPSAPAAPPASKGVTAIALYDYAADESNELSFPEGATITNIEKPDEDWWHGEYNGSSGLFPANYVEITH